MTIIQIDQNSNGSHNNQTSSAISNIPDGWAIIPEGMEIPATFPFVNITVEGQTVTSLAAGTMPKPAAAEEQRENAYETMTLKEDGTPIVVWEGKCLTVDAANDLWFKYSAEGSETAAELQRRIAAAKVYIRGLYPEE